MKPKLKKYIKNVFWAVSLMPTTIKNLFPFVGAQIPPLVPPFL